jgi:HAAS domain-containing protein
MNNYPDVVATIAHDYLARVKAQLGQVPALGRDEFLREIESHLYEAYQQARQEKPDQDDVARILSVLRNLGEPAEVVSDRLPGAMVRSGTRWNLPLHLLGGLLIAVFGIPLGFGGVGVLVGILATLAGMVAMYYAAAGIVLLTGVLFMLVGLSRIYQPELLERLITIGVLRLDRKLADLMDMLSPSGQGVLMLVVACVFVAAGAGMLWMGRYLVRGIRFLFSLIFERLQKFAEDIRQRMRQGKREGPPLSQISFVK